MDAIILKNRLLRAAESGLFLSEVRAITDKLKEEGAGLESVTVILKFMEDRPNFDFGAPGPLAHFIETFYRKGYEMELLASIARRPTVPTLSLLNRLINGTKQLKERQPMIEALRQSETHLLSDDETRRLAAHYFQRVSS